MLLAGCYNNARAGRVAGRFSALHGCPINQVSVAKERGGLVASGCGKRARYDCFDDGCKPTEELAAPATSEAPAERNRATELQVVVVLEGGDGLFITATPEESQDALMSLDTYTHRGCRLDLMVDGQLIELAEGWAKSSRILPRDVVLELAGARQVGVRACEQRWSLERKDILEIRRFARRYAEELALAGQPP